MVDPTEADGGLVPGWSDEIDEVLAGDLTAALTYVTPAGGAVPVVVAPVGLRDRAAGWVAFTTSLGFGRKLDRIQRDNRVALAFHTREHGTATGDRFVLLQGRAEVVTKPDPEFVATIRRQAESVLGPPLTGVFWDRWLREYNEARVPVRVTAHRITSWPDSRAAGDPIVLGAPPVAPPEAQQPPARGTGARVDVVKVARRFSRHPHRLLSYRGGDGYPVTIPVSVLETGPAGIVLTAADGLLPEGGRRAGLMTHAYGPRIAGPSTRCHTGWLRKTDAGTATYFPHTAGGFSAPRQKALQMFVTGLIAKQGVRRSARISG
jgi:hypothetical protein